MEIQPVVQRATKRRKTEELTVSELEMMVENAQAVDDVETLGDALQQLKRRSRRGGRSTRDVFDALDRMVRKGEGGAVSLLCEFLKAHPEFFSDFMRLDSLEHLDAECNDAELFLTMAFEHFCCSAISTDDMVHCFVCLLHMDMDFDDEMQTAMAAVLRKMDATGQLHVLEQAFRGRERGRASVRRKRELDDEAVIFFSRVPVLQSLCLEAKSRFVKTFVCLEDDLFVELATPPFLTALGQQMSLAICQRVLKLKLKLVPEVVSNGFLDAVGRDGARILVPIACVVGPIKQRIMKSAQVELSDDSDEGF